jgi:hypothetical protein
MMLQHDDPVLFQNIYEQTGTGFDIKTYVYYWRVNLKNYEQFILNIYEKHDAC